LIEKTQKEENKNYLSKERESSQEIVSGEED
jgi:hypothetical protein